MFALSAGRKGSFSPVFSIFFSVGSFLLHLENKHFLYDIDVNLPIGEGIANKQKTVVLSSSYNLHGKWPVW